MNIRKFEFTEILGWSHSRYAAFKTCKRQYYYNYYGKFDEENRMKINFLKSLTSVPLEIGNITHKILKVILVRLQKSSESIDPVRFTTYTERRAKEIFDTKIFAEVYYKQRKAVDFESELLDPVSHALINFLESETFDWLLEEALIEKDDWIIEPDGFGECRIGDMKAYCKVDFLFPLDGVLYIIDWKTGKIDTYKHMDQLKGYATWASFHFEKSYDLIKPSIAYLLPEYDQRELSINEYEITKFTERIKEETEAMYAYCDDYEFNLPLEKKDFPLTENLRICAYCNFREICGRDKPIAETN